jgi:hypothetical protein
MKILNTSSANFIVKDKRGNTVILEPNMTVEITEQVGKKVTRYPFIKVLQEPKKETKIEVKEEVKEEKVEEVSRETKKKRKK